MEFQLAKKLFDADKVSELSASPDGLRFLKLRSLSRKASLVRLFEEAVVTPQESSASGMLVEAFDRKQDLSIEKIEKTINAIYQEERLQRQANEDELVSELYKLKSFDWGGLHQNSLDKTIINNYVKKITSYSALSDSIENELLSSMRGYVLCSWYNHWTSILIEDVFRDHSRVLPAVGQVKKIDFFINDVPFDLKVTYLPEGFIKERRKDSGLPPELTVLKRTARQLSIKFDRELPAARLLEDLWQKLKDHPSNDAQSTIAELDNFRVCVLDESRNDSNGLIQWLYENQGVQRFDASNRLFIVLVDRNNLFDSWKLKRAKPLLTDGITRYLDSQIGSPGKVNNFEWEGKTYTATADVLFIVPPTAS